MEEEKEQNNLIESNQEEKVSAQESTKSKDTSANGTKAIIYCSLSIILSTITNIFFKALTSNVSPIYATYFQCLSFLAFLPLSFVTLQSENFIFKKVKNEEEISTDEMTQVTNDSFSEIMEKKYYETYYRYYKSYNINALFIAVLYFFGYLLYYFGMALVSPVFCICVHSGIGLVVNIIKMIQKGTRVETFIILNNIFSGVIVVFCIIECCLQYDLKGKFKVLGIIFAVASVVIFGYMITFLKSITKRFKYYLNFGEFSGFCGLISSPLIIVIVILKALIKTKYLNISFSYKYVLFGFVSALSDYFLLKYLKLCSKSTFSNYFGIEACILLMLFKIRSNSAKEIFKNVYFYLEMILLLIGILFSLFSYEEAQKRKQRRKIETKINSMERSNNYFADNQ